MGLIKISLFGKFSLRADDNLIHKLDSRKAEELLNYLLLYRERPHPRDYLADVLWGEIVQGNSKSYLRKALWQLQSFLEMYGGQGIVFVDGEWLQINPHCDLWLDISIFEKAFISSQGIRGEKLQPEQFRTIQDATDIYQGDLLESWYQDWIIYERERLQHLYLAMVDKLMDYCEVHQQYEAGLMYGEKIIRYDRARERTHRRLMRLYYLVGDRTAALRQYQKCVDALWDELNVTPSQKTQLLFSLVQADNISNPSTPDLAARNISINSEDKSLLTIFRHLRTFQKSLNQMQNQLTEDIRTIQKTISGKRFP